MDVDSSSVNLTLALVVVVCLIFSGFISAYEASLGLLRKVRLQQKAEQGNKAAKYLLQVMEKPQQALLTLMVADWLSDVSFLVISTQWFLNHTNNQWALFGFILVISTTLMMVGELIPKSLGAQYADTFAEKFVPLLRLLLLCFYLPVRLLSGLTKPFLDIVGAQLSQLVPDFTEDEILRMVNMSSNTGMLAKEETNLLHSALAFDDKPTSMVLTPRVDMVCVEDITPVDEALKIMVDQEGYSRLPVYRENLDDIIGIIHIKDLLRAKQVNPQSSTEPVAKFVRKAHHIHEYQRINQVLKEMQARRQPMSIVTDEYGGTVGLVTIEDMLEEIVGEIHDEYDDDETPSLLEVDSCTLMADGKVSVSDINDALDLDLPNGQSIAGLVFNTLGEVPKTGQSIQIGSAMLTVELIDGIRIQKVKIHKLMESEMIELSNHS